MKENKGEQPELTPVQWMDRAIKCLYLELPAPIADDVAMRWKAAQEYLHTAQPSKVQEKELIYKQEQLLEKQELEIERLKAWKESAINVMPDMQAIGKALNVPLGQRIHDKILPGIERLKDALKSRDILQEEDRHEIQRLKASKENEGKQAGVEEAAKAYSEIIVPQTNLRDDMILTSRDAIREDIFNAFVDGAKSQPSIQSGERGEVERLKGMLKEIVRLRSEATSTQELFPLLQYISKLDKL